MNCKICGTPYSPEREVDEDGNICAWSKNCECKESENIPLDRPVKPEIAGIPEQFSKEFINFLLVNALRCLTEEQRHTLTLALVQRDTILMDALKQFSV